VALYAGGGRGGKGGDPLKELYALPAAIRSGRKEKKEGDWPIPALEWIGK